MCEPAFHYHFRGQHLTRSNSTLLAYDDGTLAPGCGRQWLYSGPGHHGALLFFTVSEPPGLRHRGRVGLLCFPVRHKETAHLLWCRYRHKVTTEAQAFGVGSAAPAVEAAHYARLGAEARWLGRAVWAEGEPGFSLSRSS